MISKTSIKNFCKRLLALFLVVTISISGYAAVVGDNDGSAFITKAEFDSLKNDFQAQIDQYNTSLDSKIDGAIAAYLSGIRVSTTTTERFPVGNGEKAIFCNTSKISNLQFGKAELDWHLNVGSFGNGLQETYYPMTNGIISITRDGTKNYELFKLFDTDSDNTDDFKKFETYTKDGVMKITANETYFIRARLLNYTSAPSDVLLRRHAQPYGKTNLNRNYSPAITDGQWNGHDDRPNRRTFFAFYATGFNWGNSYCFGAPSDGAPMPGREIYSHNVVFGLDLGTKYNYLFDSANVNSNIWIINPALTDHKDRVVANNATNWTNTNLTYVTPQVAGVNTYAEIYFNGDRRIWDYSGDFAGSVNWTTTGVYNSYTTPNTSNTWYEFQIEPVQKKPSELINANISNSILNDYRTYGFTGAVTEGLPIGILSGEGTIRYNWDLSTMDGSTYCLLAISNGAFGTDDLTTLTSLPNGITSFKIDDVEQTSAYVELSKANHKIEIEYDLPGKTALFYKLAFKDADATNARGYVNLPTEYTLIVK